MQHTHTEAASNQFAAIMAGFQWKAGNMAGFKWKKKSLHPGWSDIITTEDIALQNVGHSSIQDITK